MKIKKAIITAAGLGTRFLPITKSIQKEMLPLVNKPLIQYSVEEAVACGIEKIIMVTAPGKTAIEDYFYRSFELEDMLMQKGEIEQAKELSRLSNMTDICYIKQKEQKGLGHAVLSAKSMIGKEPFILILPDDLFEQREKVLSNMMDIYLQYGGSVVAVKEVTEPEISRYGIISPEEVAERVYRIKELVEKPQPSEAPSNLAIMGRYILMPEIFELLGSTQPGKNGEIQITDALQLMLQNQPIYGYEFEGERYDAGTPLGWLETNIALGLKEPVIGTRLRDYLRVLLENANMR
ncbi:MAG: UTP--glucose-1-phosphate uridylyltransferase [Dehalococcoidia bacterium SG8_51_3]|nr:MAG: UTP--glucose-1-phosphate uridylyltransferase [Dehalococcoidia bacterium SG8_51_3]